MTRAPVRTSLALLLLSYFAFVSLGLPDTVTGVAWPSMRRAFGLDVAAFGGLLLAGTFGYLCSSFMGGWLTQRLGIGLLLLASSLAVVIGLVMYAVAPAWGVVLAAGLVAGLGAGAIDAGINGFAAAHFTPRTVNWLHACWGVGATLGPMIMTASIVRNDQWRLGYWALAGVLGVMSIGFLITLRLWDHAPPLHQDRETGKSSETVTWSGALRLPRVWAGIVLFLLYTGLESAAGQWTYSILTGARGVDPGVAGAAVAGYWACLTIGRVIFGLAAGHIAPTLLLRIGLLGAPACIATLWADLGTGATIAAFGGLGFCLAPVYPLLMSLTPARVGPAVSTHAVGFQVSAAALGVAVVPGLAGVIGQSAGLEAIWPFLLAVALTIAGINQSLPTRRPK